MWKYCHRMLCLGSSTHGLLPRTSLGRASGVEPTDHWGPGRVAQCHRGRIFVLRCHLWALPEATPSSRNLNLLLHVQNVSHPWLGYQMSRETGSEGSLARPFLFSLLPGYCLLFLGVCAVPKQAPAYSTLPPSEQVSEQMPA